MEEKRILVSGLESNYKIAGSGPVILILHGWGGSSDSWVGVQKILSRFGYQVICPDLPGFGKSLTPPEIWGITDFVHWTNNFIKAVGVNKCFILGHSFGGRIAIRFAVRFPEKVYGVIFCDSAGIKPKPALRTKLIFGLAKIGNAIFSPRPFNRIKDSARNFFYLFLRRQDYSKARGNMREIIKKVLSEDLLPEISLIKSKTLIVWGERDKIVPLKYAYVFKEKIPNSKLEILPKLGHSPHLEAPYRLAEIIFNFCREIKR